MKRHLNTLFVTTQGAYLAKEGETVVVRIEREVRLRLPKTEQKSHKRLKEKSSNVEQ